MVTYLDLMSALNLFVSAFVDFYGSGNTPVTVTMLGQQVTIEKGFAFIVAVLPELFAIIGLIIAIKVATRIFKKFSR